IHGRVWVWCGCDSLRRARRAQHRRIDATGLGPGQRTVVQSGRAQPLARPATGFWVVWKLDEPVTMISFRIPLVAWLGLVLALVGCGKSSISKPGAAHPLPPSPLVAQCEPGQPGGRLVIAAAGSPRTFNPL